MSRNPETVLINSCGEGLSKTSKATPKPKMDKREWIQKYACRMLNLWLRWQTSLGVAQDYVQQIKKDLSRFYDDPLKKIFIETTY